MQVDPIKPVLKAPGTKHLILQFDEPLSNFAFKFNLHRYTLDAHLAAATFIANHELTLVGRCRLTL
jgi:hypothetical protein